MTIAFTLVIIIVLISIVLTLLLAGKGDEGYSSSAKRNTANLTVIYAVVIILSLIAVGIYINQFA